MANLLKCRKKLSKGKHSAEDRKLNVSVLCACRKLNRASGRRNNSFDMGTRNEEFSSKVKISAGMVMTLGIRIMSLVVNLERCQNTVTY
jgi:hypothetical protein